MVICLIKLSQNMWASEGTRIHSLQHVDLGYGLTCPLVCCLSVLQWTDRCVRHSVFK